MNGLRTARVLIIDDEEKEASLVFKALGRLGVGAVFCTGRPDQLPQEPLYGVRLLFLDMDLGFGGEGKQLIGPTISVLKKVLPPDANPLLVVIWTKHKELVEEFQQAAKQELPHLRPGIVLTLAKAEVDDANAMQATILKLLTDNAPLDLIYLWEQCVHDAASSTVRSLSGLVGDAQQSWHSEMRAMLAALLEGSAGKLREPLSLVLGCLFESLALVHLDQLSESQRLLAAQLEPHAQSLVDALQKGALSPEQKATLNRMLLVEDVPSSDTSVRPGNVYIASEGGPFPTIALPPGALARVAGDLCDKKPAAETLAGKSSLVAVEITPACDFVQGKRQMTRCVAGLLVPAAEMKLVKRALHVWASDPILFDGKHYQIVLNAHFVFGVPLDSVKRPPRFRLRTQAVVAIQAWFASHAARPGYVSVC